jgi:hypothetical protein
MFRHNEIVFLIGAGCSAEAGIPVSNQMREELETLLATSGDWKDYAQLYNYVKGAIIHADCLNGRGCLPPDIERLVIILTELQKNHDCLLFPFIGSWAPRLTQVTDSKFEIVRKFQRQILKQLKEWVIPADYIRRSEYYRHFFRFQAEWNFPLRIFSLNYDLCVEKNVPQGKAVVRGFDPTSRTWNGSLFEMRDEDDVTSIYLYKLHGSIDWKRYPNEGNILKEVDNSDNPDLIFGTDYKMQTIDPYLFYAYEFRRCCLDARVIITVGYSFRDVHIKDIIRQYLKRDLWRRLLVISDILPTDALKEIGIATQIAAHTETAKQFLEALSIDYVMKLTGIKEADLLTTELFRSEAV